VTISSIALRTVYKVSRQRKQLSDSLSFDWFHVC